MIYFLTPEQKKWVRRTGFGLLLDFQLEMLPAKLAYNVLQIFDHNKVSLKLKDDDIEIQEQDVCDVLGLPYGGLRITFDSDEKYLDRTISWHAQFNTHKDDEQITTQMIVQVMRNQEVNDNFKLNFILVMANVLIGTRGASYIDKKLLKINDNLDNLQKYNWSEYLISYLVVATESWNNTTTTFFRGSLIFLTVRYHFLKLSSHFICDIFNL